MSRSPNNQRFFVFGAKRHDSGCSAMRAEIEHHVPLPHNGSQIVALINLTDNLQISIMSRARQESPPHASFGPGNDDLSHRGAILMHCASYFTSKLHNLSWWPSAARGVSP